MADKKIRLKRKKQDGTYDYLFPATKSSIVDVNGKTLDVVLSETDGKITENNENFTALLAQKVGDGTKAELEDLSANVLGAIDGSGGPFELLSIPQNKSVTYKKTTFITDYNILNHEKSIPGGFWQTAGGIWQARANINQSEKYLYTTGETILFNRLSGDLGNSVIQFWDLDTEGQPTVYLGYSSRPLQIKISTVSPNCKFFSFAYYDGEKDDLEVYVNQIKKPALIGLDLSDGLSDIDITSNWIGKKVIYQGDSITDPIYNSNLSHLWTKVVNDELGLNQVGNYAISGSTLARNPNDPTARNPIVDRLDTMSNEANLVINAGITNDWFYAWSPIGSMDSREPTTLYGALHIICLHYKKTYPDAIILFTTAIKRKQVTSTSPLSVNALGKTLNEYNDILKEVCKYYGIRVFDMGVESGLFPFDDDLASLDYTDQGYFTHPNGNGQLKMGKSAIGYLNSITP